MESRALLIFENSIKSEETKAIYNYCLKKFVEYYKLKDIGSILETPDDKLQIMLEDYLFYLKKRLSPRSVKLPFAAIELLCLVNDKLDINFKKIRKMFPAVQQPSGRKAWTTKDIQKMLASTTELRTKALIHLLASTGCRIGAVSDLKISNIMDMPQGCMAVLFYEGDKEEYTSFLTPEASNALKDYLKKRESDGEHLDPSHPLFRTKYGIGITKPKQMEKNSLKHILQRAIKNAGLRGSKEGRRFQIQQLHGFRKRFNTILKLNRYLAKNPVSPAMIEKLMGHKINLDGVYLTPTREQLFETFKPSISDLMIDDSERVRVEKEKLEKEKEEFEKKYAELENLKQAVKTDEQRLADAEQAIQNILDGKFAEVLKNKRPKISVDPSLDQVDI